MTDAVGGELSERLKRRLDIVLEEACRDELLNGGDHETRRLVAERLIAAAGTGRTGLGELGLIARKMIAEIKRNSQPAP